MKKRRINRISRLTGGSRGKKSSFSLDLDSEVRDSAVAYGLKSVFASAPGGGTLGFDCPIVEFGRAQGKKMVPSHLTLTSPVSVNPRAAILDPLLWCSWPHKSKAAMSSGAWSPVVSGFKSPWARDSFSSVG